MDLISTRLDLIHIVARQDGNASRLLAKVAFGARLETLLARHVFESTHLRKKVLDHGSQNEDCQEKDKNAD
jgi:hypothetical protein